MVDPAELLPWSIAGSYLEACNCEAICPCRRVGGRAGGRSTSGICEGALSWKVLDGRAGEIDLSGLGAIVACHYEDDEPGSPWTYYLYVDDRGDEHQQNALALIFTGALGGSVVRALPVGVEGLQPDRLAPGADRDRTHPAARLVQRGRRPGHRSRRRPGRRPGAGHLRHSRPRPLGHRAHLRAHPRRRRPPLVRGPGPLRVPVDVRLLVGRRVAAAAPHAVARARAGDADDAATLSAVLAAIV